MLGRHSLEMGSYAKEGGGDGSDGGGGGGGGGGSAGCVSSAERTHAYWLEQSPEPMDMEQISP